MNAPTGPLLWVPEAHRTALPLVVVAHGAGGSPRYHCEYWSRVVGETAYVLCLRGKPMGSGSYYYPNHHELSKLLSHALSSLYTQYESEVRKLGNVFIGYSQGATMGSLVAKDFAPQLPHQIYLEGGHRYWNVAAARSFKRAGGRSAFFSCGTKSCASGARRALGWLDQADLQVEMAESTAGHTPDAEVGEAAATALRWRLQNSETP